MPLVRGNRKALHVLAYRAFHLVEAFASVGLSHHNQCFVLHRSDVAFQLVVFVRIQLHTIHFVEQDVVVEPDWSARTYTPLCLQVAEDGESLIMLRPDLDCGAGKVFRA